LKATVAQPQSWQRVIDIEIPHEQYTSEFNKELGEYKKKVRMPGFREGKVPASMIRQRYGATIRLETLEKMMKQAFETACKDNDIIPIDQAKIEDVKADEGQPITFKATVQVDPAVEVTGYENVSVKPQKATVAEDEVQKVIDDILERFSTFEDTGAPASRGDSLRLRYDEVIVEGEKRTDITSPQYPILLGDSPIAEFDEKLIGQPAGSAITVDITFPQDYGDQEVAGKSGTFTITIEKVQQKKKAELNEDLLKKLGDFADETALRDRIRQDLQAEAEKKARDEAADKTIDEIIKQNPFDVPPARVEQYLRSVYDDLAKQAEQMGQPVPEFEKIAEQYREMGIRGLKRYRILQYVAQKEKIKATAAEVDERLGLIAQQYGRPFEEVKETLRRTGGTLQLRDEIREKKTIDFLLDGVKDSQPQSD